MRIKQLGNTTTTGPTRSHSSNPETVRPNKEKIKKEKKKI